jgi:uncharacterized DUF497 family protein
VARFKWVEWDLDKVAAHGLTCEEVEHAFEHRLSPHQERRDGSYETIGTTPSGRVILVVWRYDEEFDSLEETGTTDVVFVITAF